MLAMCGSVAPDLQPSAVAVLPAGTLFGYGLGEASFPLSIYCHTGLHHG